LLQVDPGHGQQMRSLVEVNADPVLEPGPAPPAELGDDLASIPVPAPEPPPQAESDDSITSALGHILSGQDMTASSVMDDMLSEHRTAGIASEKENTSSEAIINFTDAVMNETIVALGGDNVTKGTNISELAPGPPPPVKEEAPYSNMSTTQEIIMEPIKDAKPLPTLAPESVSGALLDCILDDWTEWTDCQTPKNEGMKDTAQNRNRQVVQPWKDGGKPCGPTSEVKRCRTFSIVKQLVVSAEMSSSPEST